MGTFVPSILFAMLGGAVQGKELHTLRKEQPTRFPPSSYEAALSTAWNNYAHGRERNCCRLLKSTLTTYREEERRQEEQRREMTDLRWRLRSMMDHTSTRAQEIRSLVHKGSTDLLQSLRLTRATSGASTASSCSSSSASSLESVATPSSCQVTNASASSAIGGVHHPRSNLASSPSPRNNGQRSGGMARVSFDSSSTSLPRMMTMESGIGLRASCGPQSRLSGLAEGMSEAEEEELSNADTASPGQYPIAIAPYPFEDTCATVVQAEWLASVEKQAYVEVYARRKESLATRELRV